MQNVKELTIQELQNVLGGGCVSQVLGGTTIGGLELSAIPTFGTIGRAVFGANVGEVTGD